MSLIVETFADILIRGSLSAADLATAPEQFDFIGDGTGTGYPNTCVMDIIQTRDPTCRIHLNCFGNMNDYVLSDEACAAGGSQTFNYPDIGDFTLSFGDDPTNEAPFPGHPSLYLQTLVHGDSDGNFDLDACDSSANGAEGTFQGTACDSDDPIYLIVCNSVQQNNFDDYQYHISIPTLGNSYDCIADSGKKLRRAHSRQLTSSVSVEA